MTGMTSRDMFAPLEDLLTRVVGRVGVCVLDDSGDTLFEHGADGPFTAASVVKIPLIMAVYADAAAGRLSPHERLPVGEPVPGSGVLRLLGVRELTIRDLAILAISVSDNTATNVLIDRIGIERVAERTAEWGISASRLGRKMFDLEARARGIENVMTARETALLLLRLVRGECVDRATSDAVVALLRDCQDATKLRRYLPPGVDVAHKSGWLEGISNDAGIVRASRAVVAAGFTAELVGPQMGNAVLGMLGWCAYRAAGGEVPPLPSELVRPA